MRDFPVSYCMLLVQYENHLGQPVRLQDQDEIVSRHIGPFLQGNVTGVIL